MNKNQLKSYRIFVGKIRLILSGRKFEPVGVSGVMYNSSMLRYSEIKFILQCKKAGYTKLKPLFRLIDVFILQLGIT